MHARHQHNTHRRLMRHATAQEGSSDDDEQSPEQPEQGEDTPEGLPEPSRPQVRRDDLADSAQEARRRDVEAEEQTPAGKGRRRAVKTPAVQDADEEGEEGFGDVQVCCQLLGVQLEVYMACQGLCHVSCMHSWVWCVAATGLPWLSSTCAEGRARSWALLTGLHAAAP